MRPRPTKIKYLVAAIVLFAAALLNGGVSAQTPTPTPDEETIKVDTLLINIPLVVSDRDGRHVGGLKKEDFSILLDGEKQTIEYFADAEAPVSVAIILDLSGSTKPYLGKIKEAAKAFVDRLNPGDQGAVLTFDQHSRIEVVCPLTSDKKKVASRIGSVSFFISGPFKKPSEHKVFPDMYDSIYQVMTKEFAGVTGRKAIIVLTDGFIVGQSVTKRVFDDTIIEGDVVIYPMMFLTRFHVGPKNDKITYDELIKHPVTSALNSVAVKTGGRLLIAAKDTDFKSAFQSVGDELRKQYILGFYPTNYDGKREGKIALSVNNPQMRIRSKGLIRVKPKNELN